MSATSHMAALSTLLAQLSAMQRPVNVDEVGLQSALHGRGSVVTLVAQVARDTVAAPGNERGTSSVAHLERFPASVFLHAALRYPQPPVPVAPTDAAMAARAEVYPPTSPTAVWLRVIAAAGAAHQHWANRPVPPQHAQAWTALSDAAALALSVTHLDPPLAVAAASLGHDRLAGVLASGHGSGLRISAEQVLRRAATGPLPAWDDHTPPRSLAVLPVRHVGDLPAAVRRLGDLLRIGRHLSPQHTVTVLSAHVRSARAIAGALDGVSTREGDPPRTTLAQRTAAALQAHAAALETAWGPGDSRLVAVHASDPRPVQQAGEILRALRAGALHRAPESAVLVLAARVPEVTDALEVAVRRQLARGHWAAPRTQDGEPLPAVWHPTTALGVVPQVATRLKEIVADPALTPPMLDPAQRAAGLAGAGYPHGLPTAMAPTPADMAAAPQGPWLARRPDSPRRRPH